MSTTETRWEGAILDKLTANGERIVLVERDIQELKRDMKDVKATLQEVKETLERFEAKLEEFDTNLQEFKVIFTWLKWIGLRSCTLLKTHSEMNFRAYKRRSLK